MLNIGSLQMLFLDGVQEPALNFGGKQVLGERGCIGFLKVK
jgi:hypothetical protein